MAAFLVALVDVTDPEAYKLYTAKTPGVIEQFGGKFVVRGGAPEALEGELAASRFVIIEFADRAAAKRFYNAPEYQQIIPLRTAASKGRIALVDTV